MTEGVTVSQAPQPRTPSWRFIWAWRAVMLLYLGLIGGFAVTGGMPVDALVQWRALTVGVCAALLGGAAVGFWSWTGRPRLSLSAANRIGHGITAEQRGQVRRALRRRGAPLPVPLHSWAHAYAAAAHGVTGPGAGMLVLTAGQGIATATDGAFPNWLSLGVVVLTVSVYLPLMALARRQRRNADALTETLAFPAGAEAGTAALSE